MNTLPLRVVLGLVLLVGLAGCDLFEIDDQAAFLEKT